MSSAYSTEEDIALLIVALLIIITNSAEIKLLMKRRAHFIPYEQLLLSLSMCDLLVGISMSILSIMDLITQTKKDALKANGTIPLWCSLSLSIQNINLLATDRYIAVSYPLRHKIWVTKRNVALLIITTWVASITSITATVFSSNPQVAKLFVKDAALIGCCSVILLYSIIIYKVSVERRRKLVARQCTQYSQSKARQHRIVFICLLVVVLCLASNVPFAVLMIMKKSNFAGDLTLMCSSLINPFIYYFWKYLEQRRSNAS